MVTTITNTFIFIVLSLYVNLAFAADATAAAQVPTLAPKSVVRVRRKKSIVAEAKTELYSKFGLSTGLAVWGEQILLQTADGRSENILVEYTGLALGLDYTLKGESMGWNTAVKAMFLQGAAQAEGQTITYQNKVDVVTPFFMTTGLRFYPHEKVNVTLNIGASYYKLKLVPPTSVVTSYDFKYAEDIQPVAQLQLAWMVSESMSLQQEIFVTQKNNICTGWIVSLGYAL